MTPSAKSLIEHLQDLANVHRETLRDNPLDDADYAADEIRRRLAKRTDARARVESFSTSIQLVENAIRQIEDEAVEAAFSAIAGVEAELVAS